jgi:hypothetical protein
VTKESRFNLRVIDARSGNDIEIGQTVEYPDGSGWTLLQIDDWFFTASAHVRSFDTNTTNEHDQPLAVRFFHPAFFLRRVGFFPS